MTVRVYSEDDSRVVLNEIFWELLRDTVPYDKSDGYLRLMSMDDVTEMFTNGEDRYVYVPASDEEEQEARENGSDVYPGTYEKSETWLFDVLSKLYVGNEDTPHFHVPDDLLTLIDRLELEFFRWLDGPFAEVQGAVTDEQLLNGIENNFSRDFNLMVGRVLIKTYLKEQEYRVSGMMELLKARAAF